MKSALEILREIRARDAQQPPDGGLDIDSQAGAEQESSDSIEHFLADSSIPAAIFHSRALGREFVLARDEADLDRLSERARSLPVLYFAECAQLQRLAPEDLGKILDIRTVFGPAIVVEVKQASEGAS